MKFLAILQKFFRADLPQNKHTSRREKRRQRTKRREKGISSASPVFGWFPVARRGCWILDPVWQNASSGVVASGAPGLAEEELVLDERMWVDGQRRKRGRLGERRKSGSGDDCELERDSEQLGCTPCKDGDSVSGEPPSV